MESNINNLLYQGVRYYQGSDGYPLNMVKALDCFQEAARGGNSDAMNYIGIMYENGQASLPLDYTKAVGWFYSAIKANNGNYVAAYNLGRMYYYGRGVQKDVALAKEYLDCAIMLLLDNRECSTYVKSCYLLGYIYIHDLNNGSEAYPYFVEAANYGNMPEAWHNLGFLSEKGYVPVHKYTGSIQAARNGMAYGFYERAANLGYDASMYACGRLCLGADMKDEAREWYTKAAQRGNEAAKKALRTLNYVQGGSILDLFR